MNKINLFIFILFFINVSLCDNNYNNNSYTPKLRNNHEISNYKTMENILFKVVFLENILLFIIFHNSI